MADDDAIELDPFTEIVDFSLGSPQILVSAEIIPPNNTVSTSGALGFSLDGAELFDEIYDFQPGGMDQLDRLYLSKMYRLTRMPTEGEVFAGTAVCSAPSNNTVVVLGLSLGNLFGYAVKNLVYTGGGTNVLTLTFDFIKEPATP